MRLLHTLAAVALPFALGAGLTAQPAEGTLWRYVHPEAKFLMGVDWQKAKASPVGKMVSAKLANQKGLKVSKSTKGMEMLDKVNLVLVSSPSIEGMSAQSPGRLLVALEGKFDKAEFRKVMPEGTSVERFKGVDLFVPLKSKTDELLAAYVSEQFALLGDRTSIAEVLENRAGMRDQSLMERATHLASNCELWVVADAPPAKPGSSAEGPMKQLEDMESMELGIALAKGLGLEMNMNMKTVESAQGISMMAQMFMSMASNQTRQSDEFSKALRSMKVTQTGKQVHLALNVSTSTLERGMMSMKSGFETAGKKAFDSMLEGGFAGAPETPKTLTARAEPQQPAVPMPPPVPVKKTIKIVGLDSGDREVSYQSVGRR